MSKRILEYFTAVDTGIKGLDKQVNSFVKDDYQPYGDPSVVPGEQVQIRQAMVLLRKTRLA